MFATAAINLHFFFTQLCFITINPKNTYSCPSPFPFVLLLLPFHMDKSMQKHHKIHKSCCTTEEASSLEWESISMTEQEEDLICRMHKLVGDKWGLIAGRVPGKTAEEIERFWLMRNNDRFKTKRMEKESKKKLLRTSS